MILDPTELELRQDPLAFFVHLSRTSPDITTFRFASGFALLRERKLSFSTTPT
ncbi:MAG: hypothetical protein KatS3mg070_0088 [Meiothermus sp.]|uniref:hypothetical protein n=1 Tax=Meiothermus sp. TaxID=1955249 RepID=UPI0021DD0EB4|nr:hypothetical protein [Meiothermus sp.]GIW26725.1 MAG: hypothetical protein KatS3mg070_0088 [Meiothermus sp.]